MKKDDYQKELKAIKLLQDRNAEIGSSHKTISSDLASITQQLAAIETTQVSESPEFAAKKADFLRAMSCPSAIATVTLEDIYKEAGARYPAPLTLSDILTVADRKDIAEKLCRQISAFNMRYGLDRWDYAIAGSCGLFAAMLDLLCVKAPQKPSREWIQKADGVFNEGVQRSFNKVLPPDLTDRLSKGNQIAAPDSSVMTELIGAPDKVLNPVNHRLRSLAHDPILGFLFGVWDMMNGSCTVVVNGQIRSFPSTKGSADGNIFQLLGRMFGHLLSDVNAASAKGNRGMGLPAPFMGVLRMFEGIPFGDSNFGRQIEYMYVKGYDFRQFIVSSVPMAIMEVLLRALFVIKQINLYDAPFGESMLDTMPMKMNPRFRMMLALSYGTSSAVNAGKMYVTQNIMNASYASWAGLAWNGFHALKWACLDKRLKLWEGIEVNEMDELEGLIGDVERLSVRASQLPT